VLKHALTGLLVRLPVIGTGHVVSYFDDIEDRKEVEIGFVFGRIIF
jgi:uncharacterized membrane protein